jgi:hypothetical protein
MTDIDKTIKIKATGKFDCGWWVFSSKSPDISGGCLDTIPEARESYEKALQEYVGKNWGILPDCVIRYQTQTKCSHASFKDITDHTTITIDPEDIRISVTYCIKEPINKTLDEYLTDKGIAKGSGRKQAGMVDILYKIQELSETLGIEPQVVINHAMAELRREKEAPAVV